MIVYHTAIQAVNDAEELGTPIYTIRVTYGTQGVIQQRNFFANNPKQVVEAVKGIYLDIGGISGEEANG